MILAAALVLAGTPFLRGGDVSEIPEVEAAGARYSYHGRRGDPFAILRRAGWNFVRFRIWNAPKAGYCDKAHTLAMARRAKAQGMKISLDFHYSDWWADPGKQFKPAAWKDLPFDRLAKAVHDYTEDVVAAMVAQGTRPYMVQIGNEITSGMLWPDGKLNGDDPKQWANLAALIDAGIRGVHDAEGGRPILTMIHLDRGGDVKGATWWFDHLKAYDVPFDAIGLSYYPFWHGSLVAMRNTVDELARRYGKDVYIVETGYPWTLNSEEHGQGHVFNQSRGILPGYPPTKEGQAEFLVRVNDIVRHVPGGHGKGVLYWAPTWISGPRQASPYDNLALFDEQGAALPAVDALGRGGR